MRVFMCQFDYPVTYIVNCYSLVDQSSSLQLVSLWPFIYSSVSVYKASVLIGSTLSQFVILWGFGVCVIVDNQVKPSFSPSCGLRLK